MDNESEDVSEPPLLRTSEIRLIHWESQKGKEQGSRSIFSGLLSVTLKLGGEHHPNRTNQRL
ncbi:hypothetical protein [Floridanema aerugineum]|uniref:Uncharacterized protein n=1 Tax=Floridaenema aerugineum BLCC-F46 TaxID=3153654 RepID=A0ABV4XI59_9CYAN